MVAAGNPVFTRTDPWTVFIISNTVWPAEPGAAKPTTGNGEALRRTVVKPASFPSPPIPVTIAAGTVVLAVVAESGRYGRSAAWSMDCTENGSVPIAVTDGTIVAVRARPAGTIPTAAVAGVPVVVEKRWVQPIEALPQVTGMSNRIFRRRPCGRPATSRLRLVSGWFAAPQPALARPDPLVKPVRPGNRRQPDQPPVVRINHPTSGLPPDVRLPPEKIPKSVAGGPDQPAFFLRC